MQYDKSSIKTLNVGFTHNVFISAANFQYPTLKLKELKELDISSISADDCILFMWTTGPQFANSIELGKHWGFEYKTVAFVWDKQVHNPGRYTLSQTEFVLAFKKGRFPNPRGARNVRQLLPFPLHQLFLRRNIINIRKFFIYAICIQTSGFHIVFKFKFNNF